MSTQPHLHDHSAPGSEPTRTLTIAVLGGTGTLGRPTVAAIAAAGHRPIALSRASGVDVTTGAGLDEALTGVDVAIDASGVRTLSGKVSTGFFESATRHLLAAAQRQGVQHVVAISIIGIDRMPYDYYLGKLAQERLIEQGETPWTILRAAQFHEFARNLWDAGAVGPLHLAPRGPAQPVAAAEVAVRLTELAVGPAQGRTADLAGPRPERLEDMVVAYARKRGYRGWLPRINVPTKQMRAMRAGLGLPGPDAVLGRQTFAEWLATVEE
ncbi:SDR family oxidoreductase [Granulicoccus phenolivorans]|uniref:SDR family oxidoreductase n=1 Tax=Granulicoccus phenolivorans TaxID=266854 RepID=UPI0004172D16|nr:NAD(P)H-binding protein [Granulicoccus phenolivorans]